MRGELVSVNVKMKIMLLVVGSLGAISKQFSDRLKETGTTAEIRQVPKAAEIGQVPKTSIVLLCVSSIIMTRYGP